MLKVILDLQDHQDYKGLKVVRDHRVLVVQQVPQVLKEILELEDLKVL